MDEDFLKKLKSLESQNARLKADYQIEKHRRIEAEEEAKAARSRADAVVKGNRPLTVKKFRPAGRATAIVCLNDWHLEENVDPETINGANEYNLSIAAKRVDKTFQKALKLFELSCGMSKIRDIVVWLGGDLINGTIHEELEEGNFLGPTEAIIEVQEHVIRGLDLLHKETGRTITVPTSFGNHGRTTKRRRIATGYRHSWEWGAYKNLERHYRGTRIKFKVDKGYHNWLEIQGRQVRFHHGDAVNFGGGVGGITIPLKKKIAMWNKRNKADLDILGHFHQFINHWDFVVCGCLVGYNAYAENIGAEYQDPTQTFLVIDRDRGKTICEPIFCD